MSTAQETHAQTHALADVPEGATPGEPIRPDPGRPETRGGTRDAPPAPPLLDLDALVPTRPQVKFPGGKLYELTVLSDLGIVELKSIEKLSAQVAAFQGREDDLTDDETAIVKDALDRLALLLVRDATPEEVGVLDDYQKLALARNFNAMLPARKEGEESGPFPISES